MSVITEEVTAQAESNNDHSYCLVCGHLNPRSLNLRFQPVGEEMVQAQFQGNEELQGYSNLLHGGIITALLDAAMIHCLFHKGIQAVTGDLHVRFVLPISSNSGLTIRAWLSSAHPPLYRLHSEITVDHKVMAWANAKCLQRRAVK